MFEDGQITTKSRLPKSLIITASGKPSSNFSTINLIIFKTKEYDDKNLKCDELSYDERYATVFLKTSRATIHYVSWTYSLTYYTHIHMRVLEYKSYLISLLQLYSDFLELSALE